MIFAFRSSRCSIVRRCTIFLLLCFLIVDIHASGILIPHSVEVIRLRSSVDSFLDITSLPVRISINKLDFLQNWIVGGLMGAYRNGVAVNAYESYIPVVLFNPFPQRLISLFPDVDFAALASNSIDYAILAAAGSSLSFRRNKCDQSDRFEQGLKPCSFRQRRTGFILLGQKSKTSVYLNSVSYGLSYWDLI